MPLFFLATTVHHSVDLENFIPVEQISDSNPINPLAEVLEEISFEDDIYSHLHVFGYLKDILTETELVINEKNLFTLKVPSPPPDFV